MVALSPQVLIPEQGMGRICAMYTDCLAAH